MRIFQDLHPFSKEIWDITYRYKDEKSIYESLERCINEVVKNEHVPERRKWLLEELLSLLDNISPGGRILANLGIPERIGTTLHNCFVHHVSDVGLKDPDSIEGIYAMLEAQAQTLKSEGGYGSNFSWIRPAGSYIHGIATRTPGVLAFLQLWDLSSKVVTSGYEGYVDKREEGEKRKIRKGAQMWQLCDWHPEIFEFIRAKQTPGRFTKANMSVTITEGFMESLKRDGDWDLVFPKTTSPYYHDEWNGILSDWKHDLTLHRTVKASELWDEIMWATYNRNEPGVFFADLANKFDPVSYLRQYICATNPCGEIPMPTGVCCLGNLLLTSFVEIGADGKPYFDWPKFRQAARALVRYLDNILDLSNYPLPIYKEMSQLYRRIGGGVLGLGSVHYMLGIRYGSEESKAFTRELFKTKAEQELIASAELGEEKGSFPLFDREKFFNTHWWKNLLISDEVKEYVESIGCMRNSHRSMVAPTGNTGVVVNIASGGIEPVFGRSYKRWAIVPEVIIAELRVKGMEIPDKTLDEFYETAHLKFSQRGDETILKGSFEGREYEFDTGRGLIREELVEDYGWVFAKTYYPAEEFDRLEKAGVFVTADELTPDEHLDILGIASHYTDHAISKTINVKESISFEEFKHIYQRAYDLNIKGVTTYREGTMTVVLEKEKETHPYEKLYTTSPSVIFNDALLPEKRYSQLNIVEDGTNKWYIHTDFLDSNLTIPIALWVNTNSEYEDEDTEIAASLIDDLERLCIMSGIDIELVHNQSMKYSHQENVVRVARAIGMALRHKIPIADIVEVLESYNKNISTFLYHIRKHLAKYIPDQMESHQECPSCKTNNLIYEAGCKLCKNCGYSIC